jgi:hypothetical protein
MLTFQLTLSSGLLVFLATAITLRMMGLVLASRAAVFALLHRTAFGSDEKELSVCERSQRLAVHRVSCSEYLLTTVIAGAYTVTPDAGVACPLLAVHNHCYGSRRGLILPSASLAWGRLVK